MRIAHTKIVVAAVVQLKVAVEGGEKKEERK
jgi:hypothetical protein